MNISRAVVEMRKLYPGYPSKKLFTKIYNEAKRGRIKYAQRGFHKSLDIDYASFMEWLNSKPNIRMYNSRSIKTNVPSRQEEFNTTSLTQVERRIMANTCRKVGLTMAMLVTKIVRKYIEDQIDTLSIEV